MTKDDELRENRSPDLEGMSSAEIAAWAKRNLEERLAWEKKQGIVPFNPRGSAKYEDYWHLEMVGTAFDVKSGRAARAKTPRGVAKGMIRGVHFTMDGTPVLVVELDSGQWWALARTDGFGRLGVESITVQNWDEPVTAWPIPPMGPGSVVPEMPAKIETEQWLVHTAFVREDLDL